MAIKIVTDSTSDLPLEMARELSITVVPLSVHFGTQVFKDGVDITPDEFFQRLADAPELPRTSQPSVGEFANVYEEVGQEADGIVSVHISSKMSGTFNAAVQAKAEGNVACPIEVIDTYQASMGLGMVAIAAARVADQGADMGEVSRVAREAAAKCHVFAALDTLEYLEKGGRIGKARALVGTLLRIRPMIIVRDGEAHELGKERTRAKAIGRLQRVTREFAPLGELCVLHSNTPEDAQILARDLGDLLPDSKEPFIARFGPVLGTYVGPGALGIGLLRVETP